MLIKKILPHIYRAEAQNLEELALAFVRAQEYSDGVRFYRQIFELPAFIDDWKTRHGVSTFTYTTRWNGYNLSGAVYGKWLAEVTAKSRLSGEERALFQSWVEVAGPGPWDKAYLFGVCDQEGPEEKALVTEHETAHAFYALDRRYHQKARALVMALPRAFVLRAEGVLRGKGYHHRVFADEIQAYLATGDREHGVLGLRTLGSPVKLLPQAAKLATLFKATKQLWLGSNQDQSTERP